MEFVIVFHLLKVRLNMNGLEAIGRIDLTPTPLEFLSNAMCHAAWMVVEKSLSYNTGMEHGSNRRWIAKSSLAFAAAVTSFCAIFPHCVEPDLVPPGAISILWFWYASPFVAIAAGYGIAVLNGYRIGKAIFLTACCVLAVDLFLLLPIAASLV